MLGLIKSSQVSFLHFNICLFVHVRLSAYVVAHAQGSEDNFLESVLFFDHVGPEDGTLSSRLLQVPLPAESFTRPKYVYDLGILR